MSYDIDLLTSRLRLYFLDTLCQFFAALFNGSRTVVLSVKNSRAVIYKFLRNSSPVIKVFKVSEENPVNQQDGIYLHLRRFKSNFIICSLNDLTKHNKVEYRHHSKKDAQCSPFNAKLSAIYVNQNYSDPEKDRFYSNYQKYFYDKNRWIVPESAEPKRTLKKISQIIAGKSQRTYQENLQNNVTYPTVANSFHMQSPL